MKLRKLFAGDDAVSPVIGVILMVAITVILAAVIGTFVLSLGSDLQNNAPNAQFTFSEEDNGGLTITHDGGQNVDVDKINVSGDANIDASSESNAECQQDDWGNTTWSGDGELSAGDSCTIPSTEVSSSEEIRITWESDNGGTSATLAKYEY